jgi:hypothetical protein
MSGAINAFAPNPSGDMKSAADEIVARAHPLPETVTRDHDRNVRVWFAFLCVVKSAAKRLRSHEREIIFRSQKGEAAPHFVISADARNGKLNRGHVRENISAVFTQFAVLVVGKLAIIVARVLARGENVYHFLWPNRHDRMQDGGFDHCENGRVHPDRECECHYRYGGESR